VYLFFKRVLFKETFLWIPLSFYIIYALCLSLVLIIPNLQFRWFVTFPFLIAVFSIAEVTKLLIKHQKFEKLFYLNIIVLAIFNILLIGIW
jgi:hypothetical protein